MFIVICCKGNWIYPIINIKIHFYIYIFFAKKVQFIQDELIYSIYFWEATSRMYKLIHFTVSVYSTSGHTEVDQRKLVKKILSFNFDLLHVIKHIVKGTVKSVGLERSAQQCDESKVREYKWKVKWEK